MNRIIITFIVLFLGLSFADDLSLDAAIACYKRNDQARIDHEKQVRSGNIYLLSRTVTWGNVPASNITLTFGEVGLKFGVIQMTYTRYSGSTLWAGGDDWYWQYSTHIVLEDCPFVPELPEKPLEKCETLDLENDGPRFQRWLDNKKKLHGANFAKVGSMSKNGMTQVCFYNHDNFLGCNDYSHKRKEVPCDELEEDQKLDPETPCLGNECDESANGGDVGGGDGGNGGENGGEDGEDGENGGDPDEPPPPLELPDFNCKTDTVLDYIQKNSADKVIEKSKLMKFINSTFPRFPSGSPPVFKFPNLFKGAQELDFTPPRWIFEFFAALIHILAIFYARVLIMGR